MPARRIPFVNGQIYHIFNRSQTRANIFVNKPDCNRAVQAIYYYSYITPPTKLSNFLTQNKKDKSLFFEKKARSEKLIDLFAYCLMPNHFHFLLEQKKENGISRFMALFQNSYAKYFNTKYKKEGSLFTGPFKAVRIETDEQL